MGQLRNKALMKKVAMRIKSLRTAKKISQQQFYFDTDIHIARIEVGDQNISISTLSAICKYLDISMSEFLSGIQV